MTRDLTNIINNLIFDYEKIESNLNSAKTKLGSQKLLSLIVSKGTSRDEAYKFVQKITQSDFSLDEITDSTTSNFNDISKSLSLDLNLRPHNLSALTYYKICSNYEKLL